MSHRQDVQPYRQGALDSLCGIYAIINAIRCVHGNRRPRLAGHMLFKLVTGHAERVVSCDAMLNEGIEPAPLWRITRASIKEINATYGTAFVANRPFAHGPRKKIEALHAAMVIEFDARPTAYIICLTGRHDHWTVVNRVAARSFMLADSDGLQRVNLDHCSTIATRGSGAVQCHVVVPRLIICISDLVACATTGL